jgi:uncharacterized membrane protein YhaH (DUF805 family)
MQPRFAFSPGGPMAPRAFAIAIVAVYLAGFLSQVLLAEPLTVRFGLWPFVTVQAALLWMWFALHAMRLHDAGRDSAMAAGVALLYGLAIVLLVLVIVVMGASDSHLFVVIALVGQILDDPEIEGFDFVLLGLMALVAVPILVAIVFSFQTGLGRRAP